MPYPRMSANQPNLQILGECSAAPLDVLRSYRCSILLDAGSLTGLSKTSRRPRRDLHILCPRVPECRTGSSKGRIGTQNIGYVHEVSASIPRKARRWTQVKGGGSRATKCESARESSATVAHIHHLRQRALRASGVRRPEELSSPSSVLLPSLSRHSPTCSPVHTVSMLRSPLPSSPAHILYPSIRLDQTLTPPPPHRIRHGHRRDPPDDEGDAPALAHAPPPPLRRGHARRDRRDALQPQRLHRPRRPPRPRLARSEAHAHWGTRRAHDERARDRCGPCGEYPPCCAVSA